MIFILRKHNFPLITATMRNNCKKPTSTYMYYKHIYIIFLVLCIGGFTACKKYPEDNKLSDETAKKRLVHKWQLKECKVDGEEKIDMINTFYYINPASQMNDSVVYSLRD